MAYDIVREDGWEIRESDRQKKSQPEFRAVIMPDDVRNAVTNLKLLANSPAEAHSMHPSILMTVKLVTALYHPKLQTKFLEENAEKRAGGENNPYLDSMVSLVEGAYTRIDRIPEGMLWNKENAKATMRLPEIQKLLKQAIERDFASEMAASKAVSAI